MIIPRKTLKFTIEVQIEEDELSIDVVRHIAVDKKECMSSNAQLAKFDALPAGKDYVNCHWLLHSLMEGISAKFPNARSAKKRIVLKEARVFGRP